MNDVINSNLIVVEKTISFVHLIFVIIIKLNLKFFIGTTDKMAREIHCFDAISDIIVRVEVEKNGTRKSTRVFVIVKYKVKKNFNFKVQKSGKKCIGLVILYCELAFLIC